MQEHNIQPQNSNIVSISLPKFKKRAKKPIFRDPIKSIDDIIKNDQSIAKGIEYIQRNLSNKKAIDLLLEKNPYFAPYFLEKTGYELMEFTDMLRVYEIMQSIMQGMSIDDAVYKVGYKKRTAPQEDFQRITGMDIYEFKASLMPKKLVLVETPKKGLEEILKFDPREKIKRVIDYYSRIGLAVKYIEENFDNTINPINLESIAKVAAMERTYFSTYFHDKTGYTFKEFLNRFRVYKSIEIMHTKKNLKWGAITYIFNEVGYNDLTTFQRNFKKVTEKPPFEFYYNLLFEKK